MSNLEIHVSLIKRLKISILPCEYIFLLMNFTVNKQHFQTVSALHSVDARNRLEVHRPAASLSCFQRTAYYSGIKIFNNLSCRLKSFINKNVQFKAALKRYLNTCALYSVDQLIMFKNES
jgi:hypothetical protein